VITELQPLCAGRVSPHHPRSQGPFAPAVCYCHHHCSYGPMRQSHVHQRISRLAVISPASRTGDLPCVASQALRPCRRPYTGELLRGIRPTLPRGFRLSPRRMSSALSCPATAFARESFSALQRFLYVAAWSLARPLGQSRLATARASSLELSSSGRPFSTSNSLRGRQAFTTAGPSPAGLRCLQAARRVAGWRASQGTIKEPDYVSTQLHYHPGRWDFPSPVGRAGTQRPPSRSSLARTQVSDQFAPAYRDEVL